MFHNGVSVLGVAHSACPLRSDGGGAGQTSLLWFEAGIEEQLGTTGDSFF